jgi:hypothetical protein
MVSIFAGPPVRDTSFHLWLPEEFSLVAGNYHRAVLIDQAESQKGSAAYRQSITVLPPGGGMSHEAKKRIRVSTCDRP